MLKAPKVNPFLNRGDIVSGFGALIEAAQSEHSSSSAGSSCSSSSKKSMGDFINDAHMEGSIHSDDTSNSEEDDEVEDA